jgi:hypothetical protein
MLCQITKLSLCTSNIGSVEASGSIPLGPSIIRPAMTDIVH